MAIPRAPKGLSSIGRKFWKDTWSVDTAWLSPEVDGATVALAARLHDEIESYRTNLAIAALLKESIVTPTGEVVGQHLRANPQDGMLGRAERQLERWLVVLAIPPTARAGLGLVRIEQAGKLAQLMAGRRSDGEIVDAEMVEEDPDRYWGFARDPHPARASRVGCSKSWGQSYGYRRETGRSGVPRLAPPPRCGWEGSPGPKTGGAPSPVRKLSRQGRSGLLSDGSQADPRACQARMSWRSR